MKKHPQKAVKRHPAKPKKKAKIVGIASRGPRATGLSGVPVAAASTRSSSISLALLLGVALGLSLLLVAVAATPPWLLPKQMVRPVYEHREAVMFGGFATAISIGVGLLIALLGS